MKSEYKEILASKRGLKLLLARTAQYSTFPITLLCLATPFFPLGTSLAITVIALLSIVIIFGVIAFFTLHPGTKVKVDYRKPKITISVKVGDLFDQKSSIVIGFSDTFDTDISDETIISKNSVQGQFTQLVYQENWQALDNEIRSSLDVQDIEPRKDNDKIFGSQDRYSLGTVATLRKQEKRFYCLAYTSMGLDKRTHATLDDIWVSLSSLWNAVDLYDRDNEVSIATIGTERARIGCLGEESMIKIIALSYFAHCEKDICCKELTIVVHPSKRDSINLLEIKAFLDSLK